jgi:hypothetical protein
MHASNRTAKNNDRRRDKNSFYSLLPGLTDMVDLSVFLLEADTHNV